MPGVTDIVQIVTAIPPAICGVGDYAFEVNRKLGETLGFTPRLYAPRRRDATRVAGLENALRTARVAILQYSPYSYQKYAAPVWLAQTLARWKAAESGRRLITIFHEMFVTGKPWSKAFWLSGPQRLVTHKIAQMSDAAVTTTLRQAEILRSWNSRMDLVVMPVPSNVGELPETQITGPRENLLVAFGQIGTRQRLYLNNPEGWAFVRRIMPQAIIHDVGISTGLPVSELTGLPCESHGALPPSRVSELLQTFRYGVVDYTRSTLDKSGVFASYCAHGLVPIVFRHATPQTSSLREREHFLTPASGEWSDGDASLISRNARRWYGRHDLAEHARITCRLLGKDRQ